MGHLKVISFVYEELQSMSRIKVTRRLPHGRKYKEEASFVYTKSELVPVRIIGSIRPRVSHDLIGLVDSSSAILAIHTI
jgi:hypothetical protein